MWGQYDCDQDIQNFKEANKTLHPTARSRPVDMISRSYNLNPAFDVRPRS